MDKDVRGAAALAVLAAVLAAAAGCVAACVPPAGGHGAVPGGPLQGAPSASDNWAPVELVTSKDVGVPMFDVFREPNGTYHVAWVEGEWGADSELWYRRGAEIDFTGGELVATCFWMSLGTPCLTVDPHGNAHVLYGNGSLHVYHVMRNASDGSWTIPRYIGGHGYYPSTLSTRENGDFHFSLNDRHHVRYLANASWASYTATNCWDGNSAIKGDVLHWFYFSTAYTSKIIHYAKNLTAGTWQPALELCNGEHPRPFVDSTGTMWLAWRQHAGGDDWDVYVASFNETSRALENTTLVSEGSTGWVYAPAINEIWNGSLVVTWSDNTPMLGSGDDTDLFARILGTDGLWGDMMLVSHASDYSTPMPTYVEEEGGDVSFYYVDATDILGAGGDFDVFRSTYTPAPILSSPPDMVVEATRPGNVTWTVTDASVLPGGTSWEVLVGGAASGASGTWASGDIVTFDVSGLLPGEWNVTLVARDGLGREASDSVLVTVTNDPPRIVSFLVNGSAPSEWPHANWGSQPTEAWACIEYGLYDRVLSYTVEDDIAPGATWTFEVFTRPGGSPTTVPGVLNESANGTWESGGTYNFTFAPRWIGITYIINVTFHDGIGGAAVHTTYVDAREPITYPPVQWWEYVLGVLYFGAPYIAIGAIIALVVAFFWWDRRRLKQGGPPGGNSGNGNDGGTGDDGALVESLLPPG